MAQSTRPDISFAVNDVSRFNNNHSAVHWAAVKRIFRYLKGTVDMKLKCTNQKSEKMYCYTDSDWGSDVDTRRSCAGHVITMAGGAVSWSSKRQATVALSSTEAEYMATSSAVCDLIWLKQLANELDQSMEKCVTVFCDNESAIKLAKLDAFRPRTKHIDIRFHHLREKIESGVIDIKYISTDDNTADMLTKPVTRQKHEACARQMGLLSCKNY